MKQFEVGKQYYMRSIGDYDCIWSYEVIKRTAKTVTLKQIGKQLDNIINRRISIWDNCESVMPLGSFSMAPCLTADKEVRTEPEPEKVTATNLIDFSGRLRERQEQETERQALKKFRDHYLPHITREEAESLLDADEAERGSLLWQICFRIDLDRGIR
jgi:hypothetical protein